MTLENKIKEAINQCSAEHDSGTPDYILAEYLTGCLEAYNRALIAREKWYGRDPYNTPVVI